MSMLSPFKTDELLKRGRQFTPIPPVIIWNNVACVANIPWTTISVAPWVAAWSRGVAANFFMTAVVVGAGVYSRLFGRISAALPIPFAAVREHTATAVIGAGVNQDFVMSLTDARTFDYMVICGAGWTINVGIAIHAYL